MNNTLHDKLVEHTIKEYGKSKVLTSIEIRDLIKANYDVDIIDRTIRKIQCRLGLPIVRNGLNKDNPENYQNLSDIILLINEIAPSLNDPIHLTGDRIITSDWHNPALSLRWFDMLMSKAKQHNIKKLDIAGDFINLDILGKFYEKNPNVDTPTMSNELSFCKMIINEINGWFDEVFYSIGNHEKNRFMRVIHNGLKIESLIKLMTNSKKWCGSDLPYYYVDDIRITHPKTYRQTKLSTAIALSYKYGCPVLNAHGHFFSLGYNANGQLVGDTGGLMDWERTKYLFENGDTAHPKWNNGFMVYKNKQIIPYSDRIGE